MATGYEYDFLESIEDYECPLCLHVTRDPTLTSCCGQHFCQACINRIIRDRSSCPCCKETYFSVMLDKKQRRKVFKLKVQCSMKEQGCKWIGPLDELGSHLDPINGDCDYITVSCPNNCGRNLQKKSLLEHLEYHCQKGQHKCKYCSFMGTYETLQTQHIPVCQMYPINCHNNCGVEKFKREDLTSHLSVCPLEEIACEYKLMGCDVTLPRNQMAQHNEENVHSHLSLATEQAKKVVALLSQSNSENRKYREEVARLQQKVRKTAIEVTSTTPPVEFTLYNINDLNTTADNGLKVHINPGGHLLHIAFVTRPDVLLMTVTDVCIKGGSWLNVQLTIFNQADGDQHLKKSCDISTITGKRIIDIPMSTLRREQYIKDNSLHIKIDVHEKQAPVPRGNLFKRLYNWSEPERALH